MTDQSRTDRVIREWLASSAPPRSAQNVADRVLAAVPAAAQESTSFVSRVLGRTGDLTLRAAALAAVAVAAIFAVQFLNGTALGPGSPSPIPGGPSPSSSSLPAATPAASGPSLPGGVTAIDMGADTWSLAIDERSVWVQVGDTGIARIDRATNRDTDIRVPEIPAMQFEDGKLWALDVGTGIVELDPLTGKIVRTLPGISGFYIAVAGSEAWVTDVGHSMDHIDLATGRVIATIDVPAGPKEMAIGFGSVWVACDGGGSVARVDMATDKLIEVIPAGERPVNLVIGEGSVWVWNHEQQLLRIDPATNKVVATIDGVAETLGGGVAVGGGFIWVAVPTGIGRVDPASDLIVDVIPLGPGGYVDLAWFDGELWASSADRHLVYRIQPNSGQE
jgi:hypothetical protein